MTVQWRCAKKSCRAGCLYDPQFHSKRGWCEHCEWDRDEAKWQRLRERRSPEYRKPKIKDGGYLTPEERHNLWGEQLRKRPRWWWPTTGGID